MYHHFQTILSYCSFYWFVQKNKMVPVRLYVYKDFQFIWCKVTYIF